MSPRHLTALIVAVSAASAALLVFRYTQYPSLADSWSYRFFAFRFRMHGVLHDFGTIRTYGYILFLYVLTFVSGWSHQHLAVVAGIVQWLLHAGAALYLASGLRRFGPSVALGALIGLLLLPPGLALVTDVLTEGLSLPIAVALAALAVHTAGCYRPGRTEATIVLGALLAAAALMVRPANLPLVAGWHVGVLAALLVSPAWSRVRLRLAATAVAAFAGAALIVWGPQTLYAAKATGEWTFMPTCRLGSFQIAYGITVWKYDTIVGAVGAAPWNTVNPFFVGPLAFGEEWKWYLSNPVRGAATLAGHLLMSFNARTPFTYIYDLRPPYAWPHRALVFAILIFGLWRAFDLLGRARVAELRRWALPLAFVLVAFAGASAVNAISAVEVRFAAVPLAVLACLAAWHGLALVMGEERLRPARLYASGAAILLLLALAAWTDRFEGREMPVVVPIADYSGNTCHLTLEGADGDLAEVFAAYEREFARRATGQR